MDRMYAILYGCKVVQGVFVACVTLCVIVRKTAKA